MKKCFQTALLSALLACVALTAQAQGGWKEYVYAEDGFAISAPFQPVLQSESKDTPIGSVDAHNYTLDLGNDTAVGVNATDFKIGQSLDAKLVLEATKAGSRNHYRARSSLRKKSRWAPRPALSLNW